MFQRVSRLVGDGLIFTPKLLFPFQTGCASSPVWRGGKKRAWGPHHGKSRRQTLVHPNSITGRVPFRHQRKDMLTNSVASVGSRRVSAPLLVTAHTHTPDLRSGLEAASGTIQFKKSLQAAGSPPKEEEEKTR